MRNEHRMPRWVKLSVVAATVVVLLVFAHAMLGGLPGMHAMPTSN